MTRAARPFIGLISDTHGLLRPEAVAALDGALHIVHAGDVGDPAVLDGLRELAPVTAVRGNNDLQPWARALPEATSVDVRGRRVFVVHEVAHLGRHGPVTAEVVVVGHSHRPLVQARDGYLLVNPGSAGPRRFSLPVTVARLSVGGEPVVEVVELAVAPPHKRGEHHRS